MSEVLTARLRLRPPVDGDAGFALALLGDPATTRHNPGDAVADPARARELVAAWQRQWAEAGLGYWIVERRDDGEAVGVCGVKAVTVEGRPVWNLLYRFVPAAWGRGYAREAAAEAVAAARRTDPGRIVIARVRPANAASARVAAAVGLERRPELDLEGEDGRDEVWADRETPARRARTA
jgi:[ribosomal protein S5]-alanine N-acetyltransferase